MPFPMLLAAPTLVAATKAATASVGYYVGGGFLGGAGLTWWYFTPKKDTTHIQTHYQLLEAQRQLTEERIKVAHYETMQLRGDVSTLTGALNTTTSGASISIEHLQDLSKDIASTSEKLQTVIVCVQDSGTSLDKSILDFKDIEGEILQMSAKSQAKLAELKENLNQKGKELSVAANNIRSLHVIIDEQKQAIVHLSLAVKTLVDENASQKRTIDKQKNTIDRLGASGRLLADQLLFFKQLTQQSSPEGVVLTTSTFAV